MKDQATARKAPVSSTERIASLDFIRGIAVMGILVANIFAFGQPWAAYMYPDAFLVPSGDDGGWMWITQFVLIDGKMRGLFTLLFGAGMFLFLERAWARGDTRWLQARRLAWLALFGLIHFYFIWFGDILFAYAVSGTILLLTVKWKASTQLKFGIAGYVIGTLIYAAMFAPLPFVADTQLGESADLAEMRSSLDAAKENMLSDSAASAELRMGDDYTAIVDQQLTVHLFDPFTNVMLFIPESLPLMLIGMALFRMGLFSGGFDARRQRFWGWTGLLAGGALHLAIGLWAKSSGFTFWGSFASFMGISPLPRLLMVLGLAALLALYAPRATGWLGERISAAGRAAFTNYLGTSIVMLFVFHGWALGYYGELNRPQLYLVVLLTWGLMLMWSKPWLERFRYGPLEWLWRCLTYGRLFPIKR